jgi:chemotaxis protein MotB
MSTGGRGEDSGDKDAAVGAARQNLKSPFNQDFHAAAASIKQAWQAMPDISEIADNLIVQERPDGLDIQLIDQDGHRMFPEGSKYPYESTRKAIAAVAPILQKLPNQVTIAGHTAAGGTYANPQYGSWELSMDRANVVRQILGEFGLAEDHVASVTGKSTTEPFFPNDPYLAANERVEITVLYEAPPVPPDMQP